MRSADNRPAPPSEDAFDMPPLKAATTPSFRYIRDEYVPGAQEVTHAVGPARVNVEMTVAKLGTAPERCQEYVGYCRSLADSLDTAVKRGAQASVDCNSNGAEAILYRREAAILREQLAKRDAELDEMRAAARFHAQQLDAAEADRDAAAANADLYRDVAESYRRTLAGLATVAAAAAGSEA